MPEGSKPKGKDWVDYGEVPNMGRSTAAGYGGAGLNPGDAMSQDQMKAMDDAAKGNEKAAKQSYDLAQSFAELINQTALASHSTKEFGRNLLNAAPQFANQAITGMMPGIGGQLLGGVAGFLLNMALAKEPSLPIKDNAVLSRIVNFDELLGLSAVLNKTDLSYSARRREVWRDAQGAAA